MPTPPAFIPHMPLPLPGREPALQPARPQAGVRACAKRRKPGPGRLPAGRGFGRPKGADANKMGFVGADTLGIAFTCDADGCNERVSKTVKRSTYEKGTLLIQCPKCLKHHVIADNMGMYSQLTGGLRNVEEIARRDGTSFSRVDGTVFDLEKLLSSEQDGEVDAEVDTNQSDVS